MPEGPEIQLMVDELNFIKGKILKQIKLTGYRKKINLNKLRVPTKIKNIFSIGKEIFIVLTNKYLVLNMGMTGNLTEYKSKYTVIEFILSGNKNIYMNDKRKFGSFEIKDNIVDDINRLGYDPLHNKIKFEQFYEDYVKRINSRQQLFMKMLDQTIFAGMGNYLRAEVIYHSRIDPFCRYNELTKKMWNKLFNSYKLITIKSYNNQKNLKSFYFQAYKRTDKRGLKRIIRNNRSFWYFPYRIKYKCN